MSYLIELFLFSLLVLVQNHLVRAFNETCAKDDPPCVEPLKCIDGYCLCSKIAKSTDEKNPLSFWSGEECITCPVDYTTTGTLCYYFIVGKSHQLEWNSARDRCRERGGDLLVFRTDEEYKLITTAAQSYAKESEMLQRSPHDGSYFGSFWIGAKLADWRGEGSYYLVSHGPILTKKHKYWCSQSSLLGKEPNFVQIKATGERQGCVGLAFLKDGTMCLHDWFCSWDSHILCQIHPPPPKTDPDVEALEEGESSSIWLYVGIAGVIIFVILGSLCACCFLCNKKKTGGRNRSFDSAESGMSHNSLF